MAILDFLKKIKIPRFEDDFIQDQAEKEMENVPVSYGSRLASGPRFKTEIGVEQGDPCEEKCKVIERHHDPSDPTSLMHLDVWE